MTNFEFEREKQARTNLSAAQTCETCSGDRFVLVGYRKSQQSAWMAERSLQPLDGPVSEIFAPCPDCNVSADVDFFRSDGTKFIGMDAAQIRSQMETRRDSVKYLDEKPEWVHVWSWARSQGENHFFPQQKPALNIAERKEMLTEDEYEVRRQLWIRAGSPKNVDPFRDAFSRFGESSRRDTVRKETHKNLNLERVPPGVCEECSVETKIERYKYGKFLLCYKCSFRRIKYAAYSRTSGFSGSGES